MRRGRGRLAGSVLRQVTRWGMAAVAAAMVAAASAGATPAGGLAAAHQQAGPSDTDAGEAPQNPVLLPDGGLEGFDGWTLHGMPAGLTRPAAPPPRRSAIPAPTPPIVAALGESGIPEVALRAYVGAARSIATTDPTCHLRWSVIAAIGRVESNHGRFGGAQLRADGSTTTPIRGIPLDGRPGVARILDSDGGAYDGDSTYDRAVGPMQFLPSTWPFVAADGNGDGVQDPNNIFDAALGAARYLCAGDADLGNRAQLTAAVMRYNHSPEYVALVLALAAAYENGHATLPPAEPVHPAPPVPSPALPPATVGDPPGISDVVPPPSGGSTTTPPSSPSPTSPSPTDGTPSGTPTTDPTTDPTTSPDPTTDPTTSPDPTTDPTTSPTTSPTTDPTTSPDPTTDPTTSPTPQASDTSTATAPATDPTDTTSPSSTQDTTATSSSTASATAAP